tara:strand:- start:14 stop:517 length:504 start_codon:yes stop_codon:yes gene_type:complete
MKKNIINKIIAKSFKDHNHELCFKSSMNAFKKNCHEKKLKLTPLRLKVLELLLKDHCPLGAYQILNILSKDGLSFTPPVIYRVLNFLIEQGFVHKIKNLNAYIACSHPGSNHSPTFMICRKCEKVAEMSEKESRLKLDKKSLSEFKIEESIIEIIGICKNCNQLETL